MSKNALKLLFGILFVFLCSSQAEVLMCTEEMDEDACKEEFMKHMDNEFKEEHIDNVKYSMFKIMETFKAMMKEMPADDSHTKMMSATVDTMKADIAMLDEMMKMSDRKKMQEMVEKFNKDMQPDFGIAHKEDSTNTEMFEQVGEKHNYDTKMLEQAMMKMMVEFEEIWTELYAGLREKDLKKYPMYVKLNDMMTAMKAADDPTGKAEIMVMMMSKLMQFHETPYMMAMTMAMCQNCDLETLKVTHFI